MSLLLHFSDTHFGTECDAQVDALVALSRELQPDLLIFSGDITQRARRQQFAAAKRLIQRMAPAPLLAIPGNHDIPLFDVLRRCLWPYQRFRAVFGESLEPWWQNADCLVLGVNTTRPRRHVDGEVSPQQIDRVCEQLRLARPEQLRLVVVHQPVDVTRAEDEHNLLHGHRQAVAAWAQAGADLVLGGHIHLPFVRALSHRHGAAAGSMWIVQAGTATSHRVRAGHPNSVNLIRVGSAGLRSARIERWDFHTETQRFVCAQQYDYPQTPTASS